jgi:catechol 2,3-dioxygenase-like lactoylglutathione lyase family enzyme
LRPTKASIPVEDSLKAELKGVLWIVYALVVLGGGGSDAGGEGVALGVEDLVQPGGERGPPLVVGLAGALGDLGPLDLGHGGRAHVPEHQAQDRVHLDIGQADAVDALVGMPFPDTARERQIQRGPRGLGVAIGLGVEDLEATLAYCQAAGCEITCEPVDEAWGDRVFECIDPFGYLWEFSHPIAGTAPPGDGLAAVRASWFGNA